MIETSRLILRDAGSVDAKSVAAFQTLNREFMLAHSPARQDNFYTEAHWEQRLPVMETLMKEDKLYAFFIFEKKAPGIVGLVNFSNIIRGAFQACHLGYELSPGAEGRGIMNEALRAAIKYVFEEKNLHRIIATYIPSNLKSERVLQKLEFQKEGIAKDYLLLDGKWQDHVLTSLVNPNWIKT